MNSLTSDDDIRGAVAWRLARWSPERIAENVAFVVAGGDLAQLPLHGFNDGGAPWTAACAVAVLASNETRDTALFYRAGCTVVMARVRGQRRSAKGDSLDAIITQHLRELPGIAPGELWQSLAHRAAESWGAVLAGFDAARQELTFQPNPARENLKDINYGAFRRRVQRVKHRLHCDGSPACRT